MVTTPDLSALIPASSENRWSDLLASLIRTDPKPLQDLLGVEFDEVRREVAGAGGRADRLDLMLTRGDQRVAVIEAKLLSDLSPNQLDRYKAAFPGAERYLVLHLAQLPPGFQRGAEWESLTWESVIDAYAASNHDWVRLTAEAWQQQFATLVPKVGPGTVWNDVPDDPAAFELHLRARIAWLSNRMDEWCELDHDMMPASGGGNWVIRMWAEAGVPDHVVTLELQEGLTAYEWKFDPERPYRDRLPGPVGLLGLRHNTENKTSESFDWQLLDRLVRPVMLEDSAPPSSRVWQTTAARPTHPTDRANWLTIVEAGAPKSLGKGWGMRVAEKFGECVFGARYGLPPASTLAEVEADLKEMAAVVTRLSARP